MEYYVECQYDGFDEVRDEKIKKAAGREYSASGYQVIKNVRDIVFNYKRLDAAKRCEKRIKDARIRGVRVALCKSDEIWGVVEA